MFRRTAIHSWAALIALWERSERWQRDIGWRRLSIPASAFTLALVIFVFNLHPSSGMVIRVACCIAFGASLSIGLGSLALWLLDYGAVRSVWVRLVAPMLLGILLVALNVGLLARLLLTSNRDVELVLGFLLFGITVATFVSLPIVKRITTIIVRMEAEAQRLATGEYTFRLAENAFAGARELRQLAHWYNLMGVSVLNAAAGQMAAETERRQVIAALSHDLRTSISSIQVLTDAIADGVVTNPTTVDRYHQSIQAEAERLTTLMSDLLELAHLESGSARLDFELQHVEDLIRDAVDETGARARRARIHLTYQIAGALPPISLDFERMRLVLDHLLRNALRHTPAGGAVLVRATPLPLADAESAVLLQVIDTGAGIPATDLPHVFDATYRADPSRQRQAALLDHAGETRETAEAGLGLAIAARIVAAHGGHIAALSPLPPEARTLVAHNAGSANSATSPGTLISISLPLQRGTPRAD